MAKVIGVKFKNTAKVYYFAPEKNTDYQKDSGVIVDTARGMEYGRVVMPVKEIADEKIVQPLKSVIRKATEQDEKKVLEYAKKIPDAIRYTEEKIKEAKLDMKIIGCDFSFDGKNVAFFFSSPHRVDFRELVKVLGAHFHLRIELRQVGIRDETQILGGIAPCGRECCCSNCMFDFNQVTIKMAKTQGLHLNPDKISGLCGRLLCCLDYENDYYSQIYPKMPKVGGKVKTVDGEGIVIANNMLKLTCKVKLIKNEGMEVYKDFSVSELEFSGNQSKDEQDKNDKEISDSDIEEGVTKEDIDKILD